jgi:hypothetical protein
MSDCSLTAIEQKQLALLHAHMQPGGTSSPFAKEIVLMETHVAGTGRRSLRGIEPTLAEGDHLVLRREPENPHDAHAVVVLTGGGDKLGYLPRDRNEIPARLMDAGKLLFARLESKSWLGDWLQLSARVILRDA